jgi:hypothetical protein
VGLTDTFWNRVSSARTLACRCVADRQTSNVAPRAQRGIRWLDVRFGHTRPDRSPHHDPIRGKHNSRIMNAWRFHQPQGYRRAAAREQARSHDERTSGFWHLTDVGLLAEVRFAPTAVIRASNVMERRGPLSQGKRRFARERFATTICLDCRIIWRTCRRHTREAGRRMPEKVPGPKN